MTHSWPEQKQDSATVHYIHASGLLVFVVSQLQSWQTWDATDIAPGPGGIVFEWELIDCINLCTATMSCFCEYVAIPCLPDMPADTASGWESLTQGILLMMHVMLCMLSLSLHPDGSHSAYAARSSTNQQPSGYSCSLDQPYAEDCSEAVALLLTCGCHVLTCPKLQAVCTASLL